MRKLTAVALVLGFFAATGLPTFAATAVNHNAVKSVTLSAKTKKPTAAQCKENSKLKGCAKSKKKM